MSTPGRWRSVVLQRDLYLPRNHGSRGIMGKEYTVLKTLQAKVDRSKISVKSV